MVLTHGLSHFGDHSYLFAYGILLITTMKYIFSSMSYNIRGLTAQLQLVQEFQQHRELHMDGNVDVNTGAIRNRDIDTTPVTEKLELFKKLQVIMVNYLFFSILKLICEKYFFLDLVYAVTISEELLEVIVIAVGLGFIFRIRNFRKDKDNEQDNSSLMINEDDEKQSKIGASTHLKMPPLIVIQNPPTLFGPKGKNRLLSKDTNLQIFPSVSFGTLSNCEIFKNV